MWICLCTCHCVGVELKGQSVGIHSLLLKCGSQISNSGSQAWQQEPFEAEPSHQRPHYHLHHKELWSGTNAFLQILMMTFWLMSSEAVSGFHGAWSKGNHREGSSGLERQFSPLSACLAYTKPWVWSPALCRTGVGFQFHTCKFMVILSYLGSSRQGWDPWNPISKAIIKTHK